MKRDTGYYFARMLNNTAFELMLYSAEDEAFYRHGLAGKYFETDLAELDESRIDRLKALSGDRKIPRFNNGGL